MITTPTDQFASMLGPLPLLLELLPLLSLLTPWLHLSQHQQQHLQVAREGCLVAPAHHPSLDSRAWPAMLAKRPLHSHMYETLCCSVYSLYTPQPAVYVMPPTLPWTGCRRWGISKA
jgi:hypothetical protein